MEGFFDANAFDFLPSWGGVPVRRHVHERKIPVSNPKNGSEPVEDVFTGIIDGVTGEILNGTRHYALTGEVYEGSFKGGLRHGDDAIVRNLHVPHREPSTSQEDAEKPLNLVTDGLDVIATHRHSFSISGASFFGTYRRDEPFSGTIVTDRFTYKGTFLHHKFHGDNGELIHYSGYVYRGDFQDGLPSGMGVEKDPDRGEYQGEFRNGMRCGIGTFKEVLQGDIKNEDTLFEERQMQQEQEEAKKEQQQTKIDNFVWDWKNNEDSTGSGEGHSLCAPELEDVDLSKDDTTGATTEFTSLEQMPSNGSEHRTSPFATTTPASHVPTRYTYSGSYESDRRQGEGTEWTPDGDVYTGQFLADRRHGRGSLRNIHDGTTFEGVWRSGIPVTGNGWRILYPGGDTFVGHAKNFLPHGHGMYKEGATGEVYTGEFKEGKRHGKGACATPNGTEFVGEWRNGEAIKIRRPEDVDGTLRKIAETLQIKNHGNDESYDESDGNSRNATSSKYTKQRSFLEEVMAASLENSLKFIGEDLDDDEDEEITLKYDLSTGVHEEREESSSKPKMQLHTYPNDDTFLGNHDPVTGHRTGYGVYVSNNTECTYTGYFENNLRHGYGILVRPGYGKYAGEFEKGQKHGLGTLISEDASCYHGGFARGLFEGSGTMCDRDGVVYVGDWKGGLRHGAGMETYSDGRAFQGEFKCGKRNGQGTLLENTGGQIVYTGEWCEGKYHGQGVCIERELFDAADHAAGGADEDQRSDSTRYEGEFSNGERHGYGVFTADGTTWKGMWNQGEPITGKWRVGYRNGAIYSGSALAMGTEKGELALVLASDREKIEDNVSKNTVVVIADGFGNMKHPNGDVYVGTFLKGKRNGFGMCLFANGEKWEGEWTNDEIDQDSAILTN